MNTLVLFLVSLFCVLNSGYICFQKEIKLHKLFKQLQHQVIMLFLSFCFYKSYCHYQFTLYAIQNYRNYTFLLVLLVIFSFSFFLFLVNIYTFRGFLIFNTQIFCFSLLYKAWVHIINIYKYLRFLILFHFLFSS